MLNGLQMLKTVTLSHESVLTALCALGRQRLQDKELLQQCVESSHRTWVQREISMADFAIISLRGAINAVRYCQTCGHVGDVIPPAVDCCPGGKYAAMVHPEIARQARIGLTVLVSHADGKIPCSGDMAGER